MTRLGGALCAAASDENLKEPRSVQEEAVSEMRAGLSQPGGRIWLQISSSCGD